MSCVKRLKSAAARRSHTWEKRKRRFFCTLHARSMNSPGAVDTLAKNSQALRHGDSPDVAGDGHVIESSPDPTSTH